ncbi:hypothetical protein [Candidatus Phyllobacterium onerii]|uniref:hypothetical protein n=1 Tax=Candidatus Phyllobacterium onerii TaxID=3020828 RepID=UPI00232F61A7|nr:hypothetical protein [Phyllobacterium sp. IY22]
MTLTDIERSYTTMALLNVCAAAVSYMEGQPSSDGMTALQGSVASTMLLALDLAGQTHDAIEALPHLAG